MKTSFNTRNLNHENINSVIEEYKNLLNEIPLKIEGESLLDLLTKLKREKIKKGPWPEVSIFEASNRIMSDLVILFGVKYILDGQFEHLNKYTHFEVEMGNENKKSHDIIGYSKDSKLIGEAFNVAPSFFYVKKSRSIKKLRESKIAAVNRILFCNSDSHGRIAPLKGCGDIEIIKVEIKL